MIYELIMRHCVKKAGGDSGGGNNKNIKPVYIPTPYKVPVQPKKPDPVSYKEEDSLSKRSSSTSKIKSLGSAYLRSKNRSGNKGGKRTTLG